MATALLLLGLGCATMRVSADWDLSASFEGLRTWDWIPEPREPTGDPRFDNELLAERVRKAVARQLAIQGYVRRTSGTPDFYVGYHAGVRSKLDVRSIDSAFGYAHGRYGGPWGHVHTSAYEYDEGTLMLDVVEPASRRLLWRGWAQAVVDLDAPPERREAKIREAVGRILQRFPPE